MPVNIKRKCLSMLLAVQILNRIRMVMELQITNDQCPNSAHGVSVDTTGCVVVVVADEDGDGVNDEDDQCANTPCWNKRRYQRMRFLTTR